MNNKHTPIPIDPTPKELAKFYNLIAAQESTLCWLSKAKPRNGRYCYINLRGKMYAMHRIAYAWHNHADPGDLLVCHRCDTPQCCNPAHLFLGTNADNTKDAQEKNRLAKGSRTGTAKLSESDVLKIRLLLRDSQLSQQEVANMFGVSTSLVSHIMLGQTWKHVEMPVGDRKPLNKGSQHRSAKLTEEDVTGIHQLLVQSDLDHKEIAQIYNVSHATIAFISQGKNWKHVPRPMGRHKRNQRGVKHPSAQLSEAQVIEIRTLYSSGQYTHHELATQFGTTKANIGSIVRGDNWGHLPVMDLPAQPKRASFKGETNPCAKLTATHVANIKERILSGENQRNIARDYGISPATVTNIKKGKTWRGE